MARKEINIFNVSFLDLLSGALAAVIILFIVVPKMDIKTQQATEKLKELNIEVQQLDSLLKEIENSVPKEYVEQINQKIENIEAELKETKEVTEKLESKVQQLQQQVENLEKYKQWMDNCGLTTSSECPNKGCPPSYEEYKLWMDRCGFTPQSPCPESAKTGPSIDVGFKFKGTQVVFLIDISGSMGNANYRGQSEYDKIGQVKAGLKMLVASMDQRYKVDIVAYPNKKAGAYTYLWGTLRSLDKTTRKEVYDFLFKLEPDGLTPTRTVLKYALQNYPNATDIVLLTDGVPTINYLTDQQDDLDDIISDISVNNPNNIRINAIGVGEEFISGEESEFVKFLYELSSMTNGFYVGF